MVWLTGYAFIRVPARRSRRLTIKQMFEIVPVPQSKDSTGNG